MAKQSLSAPSTANAPLLPTSRRLEEDMELMGYIMSHDLQTPIRVIQQHMDVLEKAFPSLPPSCQTSLWKIAEETVHMQKMLQAVLEYIRLETYHAKAETVDCTHVWQEVKTKYRDAIKHTNAHITEGSLPTITANKSRLERLFCYILDNALTFRDPAAKATLIHLSAEEKHLPGQPAPQWEFCLQDNGIGISEEYQEIIFLLFQRPETPENIPGCGAGLALARKIVEIHGGNMWVDSAPGEGSRFYFTFPMTPKEQA